jgi:hypothetical protein
MKTFLSIVLTFLLTLLLPVTVLLYRVDSYVLKPQPLLNAAEEGKLFDSLVPTLADTYITESDLQEMGLTMLSREKVLTILTAMFNPDWTRTTLTKLVTQAYRLRTPGTTPADLDVTVDLTGPKERFLTEVSTIELPTDNNEFNPVLLSAVMPTQLNLAHFMVPRVSTVSNDPSDPFGIKDAGSALTADEKAELIESLPEQLPMAQETISRVHMLIPATFVLSLILLAGIIVLNIGEGRHIFRWTAIATFFPGVVFLILGLADDLIIAPQLDSKLATLPSTMHTLVRGVTTPYISQFFDLFTIMGVGAMGIMIAAVVIGVIEMRHHGHRKHA